MQSSFILTQGVVGLQNQPIVRAWLRSLGEIDDSWVALLKSHKPQLGPWLLPQAYERFWLIGVLVDRHNVFNADRKGAV